LNQSQKVHGWSKRTKAGVQNFNINTMIANRNAHVFHLVSEMRLINVYPKYQPEFGRIKDGALGKGKGRVFENVAHVIFYHGGRPHPDQAPI
jgi:hypothetical protein